MNLKPTFASLLSSILLVLFSSVAVVSADPTHPHANFTQCILDIRSQATPLYPYEPYFVDRDGRQTSNISEAIGADYGTCKAYCGTSYGDFQWSLFSQQFTGYLLPFLALTAQLPFESDGTWHDFMSLLLTISCPQLATYSLSLSILNSRHVKRRLDELFSRHPDARRQLVLDDLKERVFQTLRLSQQQPFEPDNLGAHEPGLDDAGKAELELRYWKVLQETLKVKSRSFTASLATQFTWALVAFSFTWMDAFGSEKIGTNVTAYGLATSICWSWLMSL
ncbi:hypothetical protein FRC14_002517 [Serendipita sp. 396]|nr:hypothetical protein FRC14_002517 [Serendipita sp. 396]